MTMNNELRLGRFGKQGSVDTSKLSKGVRESSVSGEFKNIFSKFDTDGNHVLTDAEIQALRSQVQTAAAHGKDSIFSQKEAEKMMNAQGVQDTEAETLFEFLKFLAQAAKEDENGEVISSDVDADGNAVIVTQQGNKEIKTTYDKDSQKPSVQVVTEGDTEETYTYVEGKPVLTKKIENKGKANEKVTTITVDAQGNTVSTKVVEKTEEGTTETVTEGEKETVTKKDKNGKDVEIVVTENKDDATKFKKTTTTFTENGRKEVIEDSTGKTEKEYIGDNRVITKKNGVTTDVTKKEDGKGATEVVTKEGSDARTVNDLNENNHRLSSKKTVNGKEYTLNYDGEGNINGVVVQFGENIDKICKKFGCTKEELLEVNKDIVKTAKGGRKFFAVGAKIKVPDKNYNVEADAKFLQNRDTSEQAIAKYKAWQAEQARIKEQHRKEDAELAERSKNRFWITEQTSNSYEELAKSLFAKEGITNPTKRQIELRIKELQEMNSNVKDGEIKGKRIKVSYNNAYADELRGKIKAREQGKVSAANGEKVYQKLMDSKGWLNDDEDAMKKALNEIDNYQELAKLDEMLRKSGKYKNDTEHTSLEKFLVDELGLDESEKYIQKWIDNGVYTGKSAINAQARMAVRRITEGCDGFGTDCDDVKKGVRMIKAPRGNNPADAKAVYDKVEKLIQSHSKWYQGNYTSLRDYLEGDLFESEVKQLEGFMAQSNAIQGEKKAQVVHDLVKEAVSGAGTNIEYLQDAIKAMNSPEDMAKINEKLEEYCAKKGIKSQIEGQSALQRILYDECDTFLGISTDHKEIRKFNEMLISQGAYTPEQVVNIRAEQAVLQMLSGSHSNAIDAVQQVKDPQVLAKMDKLMASKGYGSVQGYLNNKFGAKSEKSDLVLAEFAANKLLDDKTAAEVALRLIGKTDFDSQAKGLMAIRTEAQVKSVDAELKKQGSSLEKVYEQFNKDKEMYKDRAATFDFLAQFGGVMGLGSVFESISDSCRENTDMSDNIYMESENAKDIPADKKAAYDAAVKVLEADLEKLEADYKAALEDQGIVSGFINEFCSVQNIGTTRDEIEARIEHDKESIRLLKMAAEGKLTKFVNGKSVNVSFEEVYKERQSSFVTANGASMSAVWNKINPKEETNFDAAKVTALSKKGETLVAMDYAKENIASAWQELEESTDTKSLSAAIHDTLKKLSQMSGKELDLKQYGYQFYQGVIVDFNLNPVSMNKLQEISSKLKQGLVDVANTLYGSNISSGVNAKQMSKELDNAYDNKKEQFKEDYRQAFGQEPTDEMLESYMSTINNGKMVLNVGAMIGAAIAAPFTGGGSLAVFTAVAGTSLVLNGAEHATDANGWTDSEMSGDFTQAAWDGALAAVGFKVGQFAEGFAQGTKVIGAQAIAKNNQILSKVIADPKKLDMATKIVTRAEAMGIELSSDALQSLAEMYCKEGEFNAEEFITAMVLSAAGNAAGHIKGGIDDIKGPAPKAEVSATPVTDKASSKGSAPQGTVKVGEAKANEIAQEVEAAIAKPNITATELADLRKKVSAFSNRDLRNQLLAKIDAKGSLLPSNESSAFKSAKKAQVKADADHVFEKSSALSDTDCRVIREHIELTNDVKELETLRAQVEGKYGVTADKKALVDDINAKIKQLDSEAKPVSQKKDEVTKMLGEKQLFGKGLSGDEMKQIQDYIKTINSESELNELKNMLPSRKQLGDARKNLDNLIEAQRAKIKGSEVAPAQVKQEVAPANVEVTGTPEKPVLSSEITQTFSAETQKTLLDNLENGKTLTAHKDGFSYIIKNDNGTIKITEKIDHNEFCRNIGNDGKEINSKYISTSIETRQHFNQAIESGEYTQSVESYKNMMAKAHQIAYSGKNGIDFHYKKDGVLYKMEPGKYHGNEIITNNRVEESMFVENIAKQYGDSFKVNETSNVKLNGIDEEYLPKNGYGQHKYPPSSSLDQYMTQMHRTAKEALELIESGASQNQILKKLAEHYQYAANARPYTQINNSLFMNEINTLLKRAGMKTMPHGMLDHAAQRLQPETFQKYFADQYHASTIEVDTHVGNKASQEVAAPKQNEVSTPKENEAPVVKNNDASEPAEVRGNTRIKNLVANLPENLKSAYKSISEKISNLKHNVTDYITLKSKISTTFSDFKEIKNDLLEKLEQKWQSFKKTVSGNYNKAKDNWHALGKDNQDAVKDMVSEHVGDAAKVVIRELDLPPEIEKALTGAIDNMQLAHDLKHCNDAQDVFNILVDRGGDEFKAAIKASDLPDDVKADMIGKIDNMQQVNSQLNASIHNINGNHLSEINDNISYARAELGNEYDIAAYRQESGDVVDLADQSVHFSNEEVDYGYNNTYDVDSFNNDFNAGNDAQDIMALSTIGIGGASVVGIMASGDDDEKKKK